MLLQFKKVDGGNPMYSFKNDYSEGAHPRILNALLESNLVQEEGYGEDQYSRKAIELLKEKMGHHKCRYSFIIRRNTNQSNCHFSFLKTS